jgi:hypothetical protein
MDTSTDPSRGFALKALKIFLLTMLNVSLISISSLAFALPVVNLTLDHGDMSEATLSTGMFTVTRSATNGADYNTTDQGYISHLNQRSLTIPANETSMSSTVTPIKDNLIEGTDTVTWTLYSDEATYTVGTDTLAEMTITDDVAEVTLTLDDGEMDEATLGTGKFTVTRTTNGKGYERCRLQHN